MLFLIGVAAVIAGLVFNLNDVTWFKGEEGLAVPLIVIGAGLIVGLLLLQALVFRQATKRFDRF